MPQVSEILGCPGVGHSMVGLNMPRIGLSLRC